MASAGGKGPPGVTCQLLPGTDTEDTECQVRDATRNSGWAHGANSQPRGDEDTPGPAGAVRALREGWPARPEPGWGRSASKAAQAGLTEKGIQKKDGASPRLSRAGSPLGGREGGTSTHQAGTLQQSDALP